MRKYFLSMLTLISFALGFIASVEGDIPTPTQPGVPTIQILQPSAQGAFATMDDIITIAGVAQSDAGLQAVTYSTSTGVQGIADGLENWTIADLPLQDGDNVVTVTATDKNSKVATAKITITKNAFLTFQDVPFVDNTLLYAGTPQELWITVGIEANERLVEGSIRLIEVDEAGELIGEVCQLFDDGDLSAHGDEIKSDNVYSCKHVFNILTAGTHYFRVVGRTLEAQGEVSSFSAIFTLIVFDKQSAEEQVKALIDYKQYVEAQLATIINSGTLTTEQIEAAIIEWLKAQTYVAQVVKEGYLIRIDFTIGLSSYIYLGSDKGVIKGGSSGRASTPAIPLNMQTRGSWQKLTTPRLNAKGAPAANDIIQNKNVLIWSPFENNFVEDMEPALRPIFEQSPAGFNVQCLKNEACNTQSLLNLGNYGVIVLDSHGMLGNLILTREKVESLYNLGSAEVYKDYIYQYVSNALYFVTMAYYREDAAKMSVETFLAVTPKFFDFNIKSLPNSVVFNGTCESMMNDSFANTFIGKGAKTYLGFSSQVTVYTCNKKAIEFFTKLAGEQLLTTGEAYVADTNISESYGNKTWTTAYLMSGRDNMHFTLGLINGDFEYGNLSGWNVDGDGRIITQLGFLMPTQASYMGIISTGLGYTTNYGSIWQTFKVTTETTLSFDWNFLSEEFLEYIGSAYQDYLRLTIACDGEKEVIYFNNVDSFASLFGAANGVQGNLIPVSPDIVFDRGGVYMTGWQTTTIDITKYQGKVITLMFENGDVGDSIYDSATLLDMITVY